MAIREGDSAIKTDTGTDSGSAHAPWLFDAEEGIFEAPLQERFTVVMDSEDDDQPALLDGHDAFPDATAAVIVPDESWLAAFRRIWTPPRSLWWR
jgi:hypothetical protein